MGEQQGVGTLSGVTVSRHDEGTWIARGEVMDLAGDVVEVEAVADDPTLAKAQLAQNARDRAFYGSMPDIHDDTTLGELTELTIQALRDGRLGRYTRIQSINQYEHYMVNLRGKRGDPAIANLCLRDCTVSVLQAWLDFMWNRAPTSARMTKVLLGHAFDLAIRSGLDLWPVNPAKQCSLKIPKDGDVVELLDEEISGVWQRVCEWEQGFKRRTDLSGVVGTLIATGTRPSEALALRWESVDIESDPPTVTIDATVVRHDGTLVLQETPKSAAGYRILPIPEWYADMLRTRRETATGPMVFPNIRGGLLDPRNIATRFRDARGSEFAHVRMKDFRSTVATAIDRAHGVEAAARFMGHQSPVITGRHYIKRPLRAGDHRNVLDLLSPLGGVGVADEDGGVKRDEAA